MWARRCTLAVYVLAAQYASLLAALEWCVPLAWPILYIIDVAVFILLYNIDVANKRATPFHLGAA